MLFRCAVSDAVSCLVLGRLLQARVLLINALCNQIAREASVLSSLLMRGRSPEWLRHHCLNSLQRSKWSLVSGIFGRWVAMMLLRCAVSDAVSFLPLGLSSIWHQPIQQRSKPNRLNTKHKLSYAQNSGCPIVPAN